MRKIVLAGALALGLGGCASLDNLQRAVTLGTISVNNPIDNTRLRQIESAVSLVFTGLNTWKRACVSGLIPDTCKQQIRTVQIYTVQIPPYLKELRAFVRNNDQVNAGVVYNELFSIIDLVKSKAAASGQTLGG